MPRVTPFRTALCALLLWAGAPQMADAASINLLDAVGGQKGMVEQSAEKGPLDRALALLEAGKPADAAQIARRVIADAPQSAAAHEVLGVALALQDRVPDAIKALQRATELNPRQYTAWTKLGDVARAMGDPEKAVSFYRQALQIAPDDRLANQRVGQYLEQRGAAREAIAHLEKGVAGLPPDYPGVRVDLGRLYVRTGQPQQALKLLARWEEAADGAPAKVPAPVLSVLGEAWLAAGEPAKAAQRFRAVLKQRSGDVPALIGLGRAERALDDPNASIKTLARAAKAAPKEATPQIELAASEAAAGLGKAAEARLDALVAAKARPGGETLAAAAQLYGSMGLYDKARDGFARAIELRPDDAALRGAMAVTQLRLGDSDGALAQSRKRLELAPGDADAAFMVGMLEQNRGNRSGAVAQYERALKGDPNHWQSLNNLAAIRLAEGRTDEALGLALRADKAEPANPTVLDTLARVYETQGDKNRVAETRLRIGEAYLAARRTEDARKVLQEAAAVATDAGLRARIAARLDGL